MITDEQLVNWFTYHPPKNDQVDRYQRIRQAGLTFARAIIADTPPGPDQTAAVRLIRQTVWTANADIACEEAK